VLDGVFALLERPLAVERYNKIARAKGTTPALTEFIEKGETKDVKSVIRDVSRLLTWKKGLSKIAGVLLKHFRRLLRKADGLVMVSDW
jgi:hypothetical protein